MLLVQKLPFFKIFFLGNTNHENVFYDILERKNAFLDYRNNKFKKSKIFIFPKGLIHGFWSKIKNFVPSSFLGK